jgi:hypothetical protein
VIINKKAGELIGGYSYSKVGKLIRN